MQKQPFPVGGGSKKFEDWGGGLKKFRTGGGYRFGGGYFCWGVGGGSVPHTCHVNLKKIVIFVDLTIFASADFTPFTSECTAGFTLG